MAAAGAEAAVIEEARAETGLVALANGVVGVRWPDGAAAPVLVAPGLDRLDDDWYRAQELRPPPESVAVRLLRRCFGGGPIYKSDADVETCPCSVRRHYSVLLVHQRVIVGPWVVTACCCAECGLIYVRRVQEFRLEDVPLGAGIR